MFSLIWGYFQEHARHATITFFRFVVRIVANFGKNNNFLGVIGEKCSKRKVLFG